MSTKEFIDCLMSSVDSYQELKQEFDKATTSFLEKRLCIETLMNMSNPEWLSPHLSQLVKSLDQDEEALKRTKIRVDDLYEKIEQQRDVLLESMKELLSAFSRIRMVLNVSGDVENMVNEMAGCAYINQNELMFSNLMDTKRSPECTSENGPDSYDPVAVYAQHKDTPN